MLTKINVPKTSIEIENKENLFDICGFLGELQ
ncbi:hypothetical protein ABID29_001797 [Streptococcus rupicaprae]|uniref:Uncharacterized protein n=1 Tax=Streptococcus rupicaprae TaxID=759619 RepID=A0ABV2FJE5_9STRE